MSDRFPRAGNWRSAPVYEKPKSARLILARAMGISTDESGDALLALIQGGYGIAPRNPTNGMLIAYMEALTPPSNHESVVTAIGKARVRWQAMLAQGTEMAMSRKRCPAQGIEAGTGETPQEARSEGCANTVCGTPKGYRREERNTKVGEHGENIGPATGH